MGELRFPIVLLKFQSLPRPEDNTSKTEMNHAPSMVNWLKEATSVLLFQCGRDFMLWNRVDQKALVTYDRVNEHKRYMP